MIAWFLSLFLFQAPPARGLDLDRVPEGVTAVLVSVDGRSVPLSIEKLKALARWEADDTDTPEDANVVDQTKVPHEVDLAPNLVKQLLWQRSVLVQLQARCR